MCNALKVRAVHDSNLHCLSDSGRPRFKHADLMTGVVASASSFALEGVVAGIISSGIPCPDFRALNTLIIKFLPRLGFLAI